MCYAETKKSSTIIYLHWRIERVMSFKQLEHYHLVITELRLRPITVGKYLCVCDMKWPNKRWIFNPYTLATVEPYWLLKKMLSRCYLFTDNRGFSHQQGLQFSICKVFEVDFHQLILSALMQINHEWQNKSKGCSMSQTDKKKKKKNY